MVLVVQGFCVGNALDELLVQVVKDAWSQGGAWKLACAAWSLACRVCEVVVEAQPDEGTRKSLFGTLTQR